MKIEDVIVGEKVFVRSYKASENRHGINDEMQRAVGKFKLVEGIEGSSIRLIGYIWDPDDLCVDIPNPVLDVPVNGSTVKFNPELL